MMTTYFGLNGRRATLLLVFVINDAGPGKVRK